MRVTNDPGGQGGPTGAFAELFRLQSDFQARLAEETLRYLRRLQGAVVPAAPGTVVLPSDGMELRAQGAPGATAQLTLEVENLQRVHCMVTPQLTPLVSASGVTWFPASDASSASRLLAPGTSDRLTLPLSIPAELPSGDYHGALLFQGFRRNSIAVMVTVQGEPTPKTAAKTALKKSAKKAAKTALKKSVKKAAKESAKKTAKESAKKSAKTAAKTALKKSAKKAAKKAAKKGSGS